jgi:CBS domain-containing protein
MSTIDERDAMTPGQIRERQIRNYWANDLTRRSYLMRRQRKTVLETCRRVAVVGMSDDPNNPSCVAVQRLLGLALEIIPIAPDRVSFLGLRCYRTLRDVPGNIDVVLVYPLDGIDLADLARAAVERRVATFWLEEGGESSREVEDILAAGRVPLVAYENFEEEYLKHATVATAVPNFRKSRKGPRVKERMSKNPVTVKPNDGLNEAIWKMEHGRFRHLPVVDDAGKLIGMLSDRDVRLIRPSLAFVEKNDANVQLWSTAVQQAAVFEPVKVNPETMLKEAAELMLRWHVGGLPVVGDKDKLVGIITYTDLLREFTGQER